MTETELVRVVEKELPGFADACRAPVDTVLMTQAAFAPYFPVSDRELLIVGVLSFFLFLCDIAGWPFLHQAKWWVLAAAFIFASYRIWKRAELARSSDAVHVLVLDVTDIRDTMKWIIESFEWPPTWESKSENGLIKNTVAWPFAANGYQDPVFRETRIVRTRILHHVLLTKRVFAEHRLPEITFIDPSKLSAKTALMDVDKYIADLSAVAMPPSTLSERLSKRRFLRSTTQDDLS